MNYDINRLSPSQKAVFGWLELKNATEARAELKKLPERERLEADLIIAAKAAQMEPTDPDYWLMLARTQDKLGETEVAAATLSRALEFCPDSDEIHLKCAMYNGVIGNMQSARQHAEKVLAITKNEELAEDARKVIQIVDQNKP